MGGVAGLRIIALDVGAAAAALRDDLAAFEEEVGQADRLVEQAARIGAQIEDIAERRLAELVLDIGDRRARRRRWCCG